MMMRTFLHLLSDRNGAAAAEMALVTPILLVLMFGCFEFGNYFLAQHVVEKAARDAARYGARLPMSSYPDCSTIATSARDQIRSVARTGNPAGGTQRLYGWTADSMTAVAVSCPTGTYSNGGMYQSFPLGARVITVSSTVDYHSLFGSMLSIFGFNPSNFKLYGRSQAPVFGA